MRLRAFETGAWPYVLPFATLLALLAAGPYLAPDPRLAYPVRGIAVLAVLLLVSRRAIALRPRRLVSSVALGAVVFVLWIGPDLLFPGYRGHRLFHHFLAESGAGNLPEGAQKNILFLLFRVAGSVLLVPVAEELFWRAWLMRRLISPHFEKVPPGTYAPAAFWITAVLFASEHGAYWDVGLLAGIAYNWWMVRTRSLADCILAHAVTNGLLAAYVLATGRWSYWQ